MDQSLLIAILSPILLFIGGLITWNIKINREQHQLAREKAREFKIATYKTLLAPYIAAFTFNLEQDLKDGEVNKIQTLEYRQAIFDLNTFGSDNAIILFNKIMQTFYHSDLSDSGDTEYKNEITLRLLSLLSEFLMEIRRDLYSSKTQLERADFIAAILTDVETYRKRINSYNCYD